MSQKVPVSSVDTALEFEVTLDINVEMDQTRIKAVEEELTSMVHFCTDSV